MMTDLEIKLPGGFDAAAVPDIVEEICADRALHVTMKDSLKKHPGCIHWHFKKGRESGVLEVTWLPHSQDTNSPRLWLSVHGNRQAGWISDLQPRLKTLIEARLANAVDR